MLHLFSMTRFGAWSRKDMPQMHRKQFIWKTAKGLMYCFTTAHVSPEYNKAEMTMYCADGVKQSLGAKIRSLMQLKCKCA